MPPSVLLSVKADGEDAFDMIALGEIHAGTDFARGEPRQIFCTNNGDTHLRELTVRVGGEGGHLVQLARDELGQPGAWAEEGQEIMARETTLFVGDQFSFWARGVFSFDDREGEYGVEFILRGVSIG